MNAVFPEIDASIRKADTIFAFSVYCCKERTGKYFRKNLPPCFHFCVRFVSRFYFIVWEGNRQRTRVCHVTSTLGSYIRATELIRWPHTHYRHVVLIYIWYRTNPLASYTSATGNPLASYTFATGQPIGLVHSCHRTNPVALYTQFATGRTC
jgi:hypothetical protein